MEKFAQLLERGFDWTHGFLMERSAHWREHTNRRTILVFVLGGLVAAYGYLYLIRPPDEFPLDELVTVPAGASVSEIANTLQQNGVIRSPFAFRMIVSALGRQKQLHAGDYIFKEPEDVFAVARAIAVGAYGLEPFRVRIPEGATTKEMSVIFSRQLQRFKPDDFLTKAQPIEGYLFPDTYFFLPNASADTVIQTMRHEFDSRIVAIDMKIASSGKSLADVVTMASILEREGRGLDDRRLIAGVLWRRIKIGMALQADATLLYIMKRGEPITKKILATDSPYNTYLHKGLPPTAIGSPSLSSLEAAVTPIDKGYLYYLADSSGITHYSKTYSGQLANVRVYLGR